MARRCRRPYMAEASAPGCASATARKRTRPTLTDAISYTGESGCVPAVVAYPAQPSRRYAATNFCRPMALFGAGCILGCDVRVYGVLKISQLVSVKSA
jgi:hypothetical protein